jgi:hypothetical protein
MMATSMIERVRREGEALLEAVAREEYEAYSGLKPAPALQVAYERHAAAYGDDALDAAREALLGSAAGSDEWRAARALFEWVVGTRSSRTLAEHDEREIAWEARAVARTSDGRDIPYQRLPIEISNTVDRAERMRLELARTTLVEAELAPLKRERLEREQELVLAADVADDYVSTFQLLSGIDVRALGDACAAFLADTEAMSRDLLPDALRRQLGVERDEATRADASALLRMPQFDGAFPAGAMESTIRVQMGSMGLDSRADGRVRYDLAEREGKRARAFCAPVRVPDEVYLVLRPHGGVGDWRTFLHELGHALHFANVRRELPFEFRWLGDNSVTEGYAMLFDHLPRDSGWLRRYADLSASQQPAFLRAGALEELLFLRRYCGKLLYELELHGGKIPWGALPELYVDMLSAATGVRYSAADAFVDVDERFYVARYLRAWQLQAVLAGTLRERFDEDWWRNPAAGPWIVDELYGEGQRELADELATRVSGAGLGFAPLVRELESRLS